MLTLGALGVVYGDIGACPPYTMKEVRNPSHGVPLDAPIVIDAVSVIFWALMAVVTVKDVVLSLGADNLGASGAYSITKEATPLSLLPRMRILNNPEQEVAQIYVLLVNWVVRAVAVVLAPWASAAHRRWPRPTAFPSPSRCSSRHC